MHNIYEWTNDTHITLHSKLSTDDSKSHYHITVTSRDRHGVSNHCKFYCLFNSLSRLSTKISTLHITGPFVWGMYRWTMKSPHNGTVMRKAFACHHQVIKHVNAKVRTLLHISLQWRHNEHHDVSNHQPHYCLLNRFFRWRSKITSNLHVTGLCEGNSPVIGEFPAQMASNAENVSIWWRHHVEQSAAKGVKI